MDLDSYPDAATKVLIPGSFDIGSGGDVANLAAITTQADTDTYILIAPVTEDWTTTVDSAVLIFYAALTGTLDVNGDSCTVFDSSRHVSGVRSDGGASNTWYLRSAGGGLGSGFWTGPTRSDDTP